MDMIERDGVDERYRGVEKGMKRRHTESEWEKEREREGKEEARGERERRG